MGHRHMVGFRGNVLQTFARLKQSSKTRPKEGIVILEKKNRARVWRLKKKSCTPVGCEKNNMPFQKVLPPPSHF